MKTVRIKNSLGIDYIKSYLLDETDKEKDLYAEELKTYISKEELFVLAVFENKEVLGFIIAVAADNAKHVFISQAFMSPKLTGRKTQDECFFYLTTWASNLKRTSIRAETTRKTEAFLRKWKFEPFSTVLSFDIPENFLLEIMDDSRREDNGTEITGTGDQTSISTIDEPAVDSESTERCVEQIVEPGSKAVQPGGVQPAAENSP